MLNMSNTKICQKCTWFVFVANEDFCTPSPPLLGDFAKNSEKILTLSINLIERKKGYPSPFSKFFDLLLNYKLGDSKTVLN